MSYQFAFNRIPRRRGGMKKAKVEAEVKNFLNLNLNLNLLFSLDLNLLFSR